MFYQSKSQSSHNGLQGPTSSAPSSFHYLSDFSPVPHPLTHAAPALTAPLLFLEHNSLRAFALVLLSVWNSQTPSTTFKSLLRCYFLKDVIFSKRSALPTLFETEAPSTSTPSSPNPPYLALFFFSCSTYHLLTCYQACLFSASHAMIHISKGRNTSLLPLLMTPKYLNEYLVHRRCSSNIC